MTVKYTETLSLKMTSEMSHSIDNLLENVSRADCAGRCDLIRELIEIGLKSYWKRVAKNSKPDCACIEVHTCAAHAAPGRK